MLKLVLVYFSRASFFCDVSCDSYTCYFILFKLVILFYFSNLNMAVKRQPLICAEMALYGACDLVNVYLFLQLDGIVFAVLEEWFIRGKKL